MKAVNLTGAAIRFEGAVDVDVVEGGVVPWRLPMEYRPWYAQGLAASAQVPAGVRLTMLSDTERLRVDVTVQADPGITLVFDLVVDGKRFASREVQSTRRTRFDFEGLPEGAKRLELYFPPFGRMTLHALRIDAQAGVFAWSDMRKRWIVYGSSITQCRRAFSPIRTWPAMVSRARNWHLTCLGFGGQCTFDPIVARAIARMPADRLTLCLGINTHGGSFSLRTWLPAVMGFVMTVRDAHPTAPLLIVSPIYSPPRETTPGNTGLTLQTMREWLREAVATLQAAGDGHVDYLDGLELFHPGDEARLPDNLHPDGKGIELMGRRMLRALDERPEWGKDGN